MSVRTINGPIKEEESWRKRTNKEVRGKHCEIYKIT
jgi:hypothetical protein